MKESNDVSMVDSQIHEVSIMENLPCQSSLNVNEPMSMVNEHEFKEPLLTESNEDVNNPVKIELDKVSDPQDRKKRLFQYIITDSETGLEACSFCQKVYQGPQPSIRQRNLMDHIDRVHLKVRSYECQFCDKKYASKSQLCTHLKVKHLNVQVKDKKLQVPRIKSKTSCQNCNQTFVNKDQLNMHSCHAIKQESQEIMESVIEGSQNDQIQEEIMENLSCHPTIKQETPEIDTNSKTFEEPQKIEETGIFVKTETDIKPEVIFGVNDSDSNHVMSTVSDDPLALQTSN